MTHANPARGEVEIEIAGETFVLCGTFGNLARFQGALGVEGLDTLLRMVARMDPRALYHGIKCLAIHADEKKLAKLDEAPFRGTTAVQDALVKAIIGPQEPDAKNAESGEPVLLN